MLLKFLNLNVNLFALDGSGICDPCEKEPTDAISHMDRQQREDITQSAQVCPQFTVFITVLHLIAWRSHLRVMGDVFIFWLTACLKAFSFWTAAQSTRHGPASFKNAQKTKE